MDLKQLEAFSAVVITPNTPYYRALQGLSPQALVKEPLILRESGSGTRRAFLRFLEEAGVPLSRLRITANMENSEAIKRSVRAGLGISVLSSRAVGGADSAGLLCFPVQGGIRRRLYLCYAKKIRLSAPTKAFMDLLLVSQGAAEVKLA